MENWEREIKEKAEKATHESIRSLDKVAKGIETLPESIQSLETDETVTSPAFVLPLQKCGEGEIGGVR